jgi:hypothetical protein
MSIVLVEGRIYSDGLYTQKEEGSRAIEVQSQDNWSHL